jgi:large subunit ribosomal protein L32
MGALPKRRLSKSRQGSRLAHIARKPPVMIICPQCHSPKMPHHACPTCGSYNGREVIKIKEKKKAEG